MKQPHHKHTPPLGTSIAHIFASGAWGLLKVYRVVVSPMFRPRCRFYPTCSDYGMQALRQYRLRHALYLILRRISRCHPWGGSGFDPLPCSNLDPRETHHGF